MNYFNFLRSPGDVNTDIAKRMRARRKKKLSQAQLSVNSDVSLGSLKRFERTGEISLSSLVKIAFALGCQDDFDALFSKSYEPFEGLFGAFSDSLPDGWGRLLKERRPSCGRKYTKVPLPSCHWQG